jgi:hypothetical protein
MGLWSAYVARDAIVAEFATRLTAMDEGPFTIRADFDRDRFHSTSAIRASIATAMVEMDAEKA